MKKSRVQLMKRAASRRQPLDAEKQRLSTAEAAAVSGCEPSKRFSGPGAEQQFVAIDDAFGIEDRLAREKSLHGYFLLPAAAGAHIAGRGEGADGRRDSKPRLTPDWTSKRGIRALVLVFERRPSSKFHRFHRGERAQNFAQHPDAVQFVGRAAAVRPYACRSD